MSDPHLEGPIPRFVGKDGYGNEGDVAQDNDEEDDESEEESSMGAIHQYNKMADGPAKNAARVILQNIYTSIPFAEMKRHRELGGVPGYKESIRAPQ